MIFLNELNIYPSISKERLEKIHAVTKQKQHDIHNLLDTSYIHTQDSFYESRNIFKNNLVANKLKTIIRESEFLKNLNECQRSDPYVLRSLVEIINSKDSNGSTPIMKTVKHNDIKALNYLLKKLTCKISIHNNIYPNNKIYFHDILDSKDSDNNTALHFAVNSNLNCYKLILNYMKQNYNNSFDFLLDNVDVEDKAKIKSILLDSYKLIQNSFSLSVFWDNEHCNTQYPEEALRYNIISSTMYNCKQTLYEFFSKSRNISRQKLNTILNIEQFCCKLDNLTNKSPDIYVYKFKILTEPWIPNGLTLVMQACKNDDFKTLSTLLNEIESTKKHLPDDFEYENYLDITTSNYNTALSFAIENKSLKCVKLLLQFKPTLGNDFEYSKCNSYILQAIYKKDVKILNLLIKHYNNQHNNINSLKNYLSATTQKSNYLSPLVVAINNNDIECASLLFEKYSVPMPEQYKSKYDSLLNSYKKKYRKNKGNFIFRITKNILNSIVSILYFLGIIEFKNSAQDILPAN